MIFSFTACQSKGVSQGYCLDERFEQRIRWYLSFSVPVISVEEFHKNREDYVILDTRSREEFEVSTIPAAIFIGDGELDTDHLLERYHKDQPIVVFCSIGYRSEKTGEKLLEAGFTQVQNLYGSIFEWANRGYELVNMHNQPVKEIHTYNKRWSRWVNNEKLILKW
jgi:rhodanese-related sulfurtransferase